MLTYIVFFVLFLIFQQLFRKKGMEGWKLYVASFITTFVVMMLVVFLLMIIKPN